MRRLLLGAVFVLAIPSLGTAAPLCVAGTLTDYMALGAGGCSIGGATFFDFSAGVLLAGATPIPADDIDVSPLATGVGLDFGFNVNALAADLFDVLIGYSVDGALFGSNTLSMTGSSVTPDGVILAFEDKCVGGTYSGSDPDPVGCSGTPLPTLLALDDGVLPILSDTTSFAPSSFFDVFTEITVDGGPSGSATLNGTVTNQFGGAVPEPSAILLVGSGLFGIWARRRRRVPTQ